MPAMQIFSWSLYTSSIGQTDLENNTQPNDPASPVYAPGTQTWLGETFAFNGGSPVEIDIVDDDGVFEDLYVETGSPATLSAPITIGGTTYPAGTVVQNEFAMTDTNGVNLYVVRIGSENVGFAYEFGNTPTAGELHTIASGLDGNPVDNPGGVGTSSITYGTVVCYGAGTLIETPGGERAVEDLRCGDAVLTVDAGPQTVRWLR